MKASNLFVKALENEGVEYVFTVPGEETLDLIESIRKSKKIKLIVLRHEQGAGFMAATYGRLSGRPGVCLVTLGPGVTNLMTSVAYAQLGAMPMVVITGQKPIKQHKQGRFQVIDAVSMMTPITKVAKQIVNVKNIPVLIRDGFQTATLERPGVVHLELPEDIAKENSQEVIFEVNQHKRPNADQDSINEAIRQIENAKHPLLLIGASANRRRASDALKAFVSKTKIPFFTTQMGKGVVDERNEFFLGTAAISHGDYVHQAVEISDLIINVGHDIVEKPPFIMNRDGAKVIHINFEAPCIDDTYFPKYEVVGDIANSIKSITQKIKAKKSWNFKKFRAIEDKIHKGIKKFSENKKFPVSPSTIVQCLQSTLPDDSIITLDNGLYKIWFARNYFSKNPTSLLLDNALATMGAGLPSAMCAKLLYPNRKVISICGDGGFLMNSHELEPAVRLDLDLLIIILRDNGYGMIKWKQQNMGFKNYGMDFTNPDFVKYAEAYGAKGYRVTSLAELDSQIQLCLREKGVKILEIPIDYSDTDQLVNSHSRR